MSTAVLEAEPMAARPLTEIERQEKTVASLGVGFEFPLFNGRQAVESQRKSGYKNTARAAREIIDNAVEAGATEVHVVFNRPNEGTRSKGERKDAVSAVAFIDNGPGMIPDMARYALSWGGGSRFESPTGIGRFGFGLPNSSINQTRRVEVYTRTNEEDDWICVVLDITDETLKSISLTGLVTVEEPIISSLPKFVLDYAKRTNLKLLTGTVVVWDRPDRLTARSGSKLKELMLDDFGVVYRYLLDQFTLVVDGVKVRKVDPLFLSPDGLYFKPAKEGGAELSFSREIPVAYSHDSETGAQRLRLLSTANEVKEARAAVDVEAVGVIGIKIARFPYGFASERQTILEKQADGSTKRVQQETPKDSDEYRRMQIRKKRRGLSFVRAGREIETVESLPTTQGDKANGLGNWPVLQAYALHWGIEVRFTPQLDEVFGIGNDKQTVNPVEDFWRVLTTAEVDKAVKLEQKHQQVVRKQKDEEDAASQLTDPDFPNPAAEAAAGAVEVMGRTRPLPPETVEETQQKFDDAVAAKTQSDGATKDAAEEAVKREAARTPFAIGFFESEGGVFYKPDFGNGLQRVVLINRLHPFFTTFYAELVNRGDVQARNAVDVLLYALAKSELEADVRMKAIYKAQREHEWSPFVSTALSLLGQFQSADAEELEEDT